MRSLRMIRNAKTPTAAKNPSAQLLRCARTLSTITSHAAGARPIWNFIASSCSITPSVLHSGVRVFSSAITCTVALSAMACTGVLRWHPQSGKMSRKIAIVFFILHVHTFCGAVPGTAPIRHRSVRPYLRCIFCVSAASCSVRFGHRATEGFDGPERSLFPFL